MSSICTTREEIAGSEMKWLLIILALLYFISPYDLIPGVHPIGWIDDIVIMILLFRLLARLKRNETYQAPRDEDDHGQWQGSPHGSGGHDPSQQSPKSPYEILNVSPGADQAEIKIAYRKLANQYHPDKVAHLGKEFQDLAEQRFKEIQEAYDKLVR